MMPSWIKPKHRDYWKRPWTVPVSRFRAIGFKRALRARGYLSPHYELREAACKDAARTPVPRRMRPRAQRHAFRLEQLRHELGDRPLPVLSWYRTPAHNVAVGGASRSKHMKAIATDFDRAVLPSGFDAAADRIFADGGFGQYPGGNRHVDSRAGRARWTSYLFGASKGPADAIETKAGRGAVPPDGNAINVDAEDAGKCC